MRTRSHALTASSLRPRAGQRILALGMALLFSAACGEVSVVPAATDVGATGDALTDTAEDAAKANLAPQVKILEPATGTLLTPGQSVHFAAQVSDDLDPAPKLQIKWAIANGATLHEAATDAKGLSEFDVSTLPAGTLKINCTVTDSQGLSATEEVVVLVDSPPGAPTVTILPPAPTTTDDLVVQITTPASDPDRSASELTYVYDWYKNDLPTDFHDKVLPASATAKGETWQVKVRAKDPKMTGAEATASVKIGNAAPKPPVLAIAPDPANLMSDVTCTLVSPAVDDDGDPVTYTWTWSVGSYVNPGALTQKITVKELKSGATKLDKIKAGNLVSCAAVAKDDGGASAPEAKSPAITVGQANVCADVASPCDSNADCTNTDTLDPICVCKPGFVGDGYTCGDVDECAAGDKCSPDANCSNSPGGYKCTCKAGFVGDGVACTDVDECADGSNVCDLSADCSNTAGSYVCGCKPGFLATETVSANVACVTKICAAEMAACKQEAVCKQIVTCMEGCTTQACADACPSAALPAGGKLADYPAWVAIDSCATQSGCSKPGGNGIGYACVDIDECASGAAGCSENAVCVNNPGGSTCTCKAGYAGDGKTCEDVNECLTNNGGCDKNATCSNYEGGRFCNCTEGYSGTGESCSDVDECATKTAICDPNAACSNTVGSYTCSCNAGYEGTGKACNDIDECATGAKTCVSGAQCINLQGSAKCECKPGYYGDPTKICTDIDECAQQTAGCLPITKFGTCTNLAGSFKCGCSSGYSGDGISYCTKNDPCSVNNGGCSLNGTCTYNTTTLLVSCACKAGFAGDGKTCNDVNECATNNGGCAATADCINAPGSFSCKCKTGYSGDGKTCTDVNECATNNGGCSQFAQCLNSPAGSFTCKCATGYAGDGKTCTDIDECAVKNGGCDLNALCTNLIGGNTCACKAGYTGDGKTCTDINECAVSNGGCNVNAVCTNLPGSSSCACKPGYTGDGKTCVDVNECTAGTAGCDKNATCTNTVGSYTCACKTGYSGDGKTCADVNECPVASLEWNFATQGQGSWGLDAPVVAGTDVGWKMQGGTLYYGNAAGTSFDTPGQANSGNATSAPLTFSNHPQHLLTFEVWFSTEMGGMYDNLKVNFISGASTYTLWAKDTKVLPAQQWQTVSILLPGYAGKNGNIQLNFNTLDAIGNATQGVRVKAIRIAAATGPCDANAVCANTVGSYSCACISGYAGDGKKCLPLGSDASAAAVNCLQIADAGMSNGTYWLSTSAGPKQFLCENGYTRLSYDTFDAGSAGAWSPGTLTTCGTYGAMLGGVGVAGAGYKVGATYTALPAHTQLRINATYYFIDSWEGEKSSVTVDGALLWSNAVTAVALTGGVCGLKTYGETPIGFDQSVAHTGGTATVQFSASLDQAPLDESFGVDNIIVWVR